MYVFIIIIFCLFVIEDPDAAAWNKYAAVRRETVGWRHLSSCILYFWVCWFYKFFFQVISTFISWFSVGPRSRKNFRHVFQSVPDEAPLIPARSRVLARIYLQCARLIKVPRTYILPVYRVGDKITRFTSRHLRSFSDKKGVILRNVQLVLVEIVPRSIRSYAIKRWMKRERETADLIRIDVESIVFHHNSAYLFRQSTQD